MSAVARNADEWRGFLIAHMPPSEDGLDLAEGSLLFRVLEALSKELARFDALCDILLDELDHTKTVQLIADWERMLALPRACQVAPETLDLRRRQIVAVTLNRNRDLSPQTLIDIAAVFGFTITIKEYFPFTVPGDAGFSPFRYDVTTTGSLTVVPFRTGISGAGDPLGKVEQLDLACLLDEIEPAYAERVLI